MWPERVRLILTGSLVCWGIIVAGAHERVLVMTYNVLAQTYVKSSRFPYCDPLALRWKNRSKKLVQISRPDIGYAHCESAAFELKCALVIAGRSLPVAACEAARGLPPGAVSSVPIDPDQEE
jgi:hypothetical protein